MILELIHTEQTEHHLALEHLLLSPPPLSPMSNIAIAVGQCGLQICDSTLSIVHQGPDYNPPPPPPSPKHPLRSSNKSNKRSSSSPTPPPPPLPVGTVRRALFHPSGRARAVFVDSEPRVVTTLQADLRRPWFSAQGQGVVSILSQITILFYILKHACVTIGKY